MNTNPWTKTFSESQDLRQRSVGCPVWIPYREKRSPREEQLEKIYQSGENRHCIQDIITAINQAQYTVMLVSFLMADTALEDALMNAAKRGVRVYVLLASENKLEKEPDAEFDKQTLAQHKTMLDRLAGQVLVRSAPYFHAKLVLSDAQTLYPKGFLLTANLTTDALQRNEELAVALTHSEIQSAFAYLRWAFWEGAEHELIEKQRLSTVKPLQKLDNPEITQDFLATKPDNSLEPVLKQIINNAKQELIVSSFGWEINHTIVALLLERIRAGLHVTLLARIRPKTMDTLVNLAQAGAKVFGFRWLHAKALCNDVGEAVVMSANLETQSFEHSMEFGVFLPDERATAVKHILQTWQQQAPWQLLPQPILKDLPVGDVTLWRQAQLLKEKMLSTKEVQFGELTANSAEQLDLPKPPDKNHTAENALAYELRYEWQVSAPRLNGKAKEVKRTIEKEIEREKIIVVKDKKGKPILDKHGKPTEKKQRVKETIQEHISYNPPVYHQNGRNVVAIQQPTEISLAQKLIQQGIAKAIVLFQS
jgi:cardiolipin synthase A/B